MRATPAGLEVRIPLGLDAESPRVQAFIEAGLRKLEQAPPLPSEPFVTDLRARAEGWAERIGVAVKRVQVRAMRSKWASCSARGTLTLSADLAELPADLVDYVLCHELVHLRVPKHGKRFRALMGCYLPDWEERERRLMQWTAGGGNDGRNGTPPGLVPGV